MCADICDTADEVIQEDLNHALANIPRYSGVSANECQCGEEIPEGRRQAIPGVQLCIDCANREALEKNGVRRV